MESRVGVPSLCQPFTGLNFLEPLAENFGRQHYNLLSFHFIPGQLFVDFPKLPKRTMSLLTTALFFHFIKAL